MRECFAGTPVFNNLSSLEIHSAQIFSKVFAKDVIWVPKFKYKT